MGKNKHYNNKQKYNEMLPGKTIDDEAKEILDKVASQSLSTQEEVNFDDLVKMFNANQLKKTMLRLLTSNKLLDNITKEMLERFTKNPDEFTNQDLLNYMKVLQDSINNSQRNLSTQSEQLNKPLIQINQTVNKTEVEISQESKEKILSAVEELMKLMNTPDNSNSDIIEGEIEEVRGDTDE